MEDSKIEKAIKSLKKAILFEMNIQSEKMRKLHKKHEQLKNTVIEAADILHNIPHSESQKIDREIENAWDIMDKARYIKDD